MKTTKTPVHGLAELTKEQQKLCDNHNIRYEAYAAMVKKQQASGREGVEV